MHLLLAAAVQHIQNGNHAAAIESLSRIIEQHPDHAEVYANLGSLLNGQGYPDKAETLCRKALALSPASEHYRFYLRQMQNGLQGEP